MDDISKNKCVQLFAYITIIMVIAFLIKRAIFNDIEGFDNTEAISNIASLYNQSLLTVTKMRTNEVIGNPSITLTGDTSVKGSGIISGDLTINGNLINPTINKKIDDAVLALKNMSRSYGELYYNPGESIQTTYVKVPSSTTYQILNISSTLAPSVNFSKYGSTGIVYTGNDPHTFKINLYMSYEWNDYIYICLTKNGVTIPQSITFKDGDGDQSDDIIIGCTVRLMKGEYITIKHKLNKSSEFWIYSLNLTATQID
jgi:hypothetical protein